MKSGTLEQVLTVFRSTSDTELDLRPYRLSELDWAELCGRAGELQSVTVLRVGSEPPEAVLTLAVGIPNLRHLQVQSFWDEDIRHVADKLTALTSLSLVNCLQVTDAGVTAVADKLTALTFLSLVNCHQVTDAGVTAVATKLTALTSLSLVNCHQVTDAGVTAVATKLTGLVYLNLQRISSLGVPKELLENPNNPAAIRAFYARAEREGKRQLNEAKLLVVGNEAVGKSALVNYLAFDTPCSDTAKTEGVAIYDRINVAKWDVGGGDAGAEPLRLNVWDFGGQEVLYETHKFFFTARSLYLIVLSSRQENAREAEDVLHEWMRAVRNRGGEEVPVVVVVNKAEAPHDLRLDEPRLRKEYPAIRGFVRTSCRDREHFPEGGKGIAELRRLVVETVRKQLPHVRDWFPASYFRVKEEVGKLACLESMLTTARYTTICNRAGVPAEAEQDGLLTLLDHIGVVVRYSDATLLDPNWLTTAVYRMFTHGDVVKAGGEFAVDDLGQLLKDLKHADRYPRTWWGYIANMMVRFNLSFELRGQPGRYLVPLLLPTQEPEVNWDEKNSLRFRYDYDNLPLGLLPRFIVEMHHHLTPKRTAWVSGVVLAVDGCKVLVRADRKDRRVHVFVSGPPGQRRGALTVVRTAFDVVHGLHPDLTITAMVPVDVPGKPDAAIDYEVLLTAERQGIKQVPVPGAEKPFTVKTLLDGVGREPVRRRSEPRDPRSASGDIYNVHVEPGAQAIVSTHTGGELTVAKNVDRSKKSVTKTSVKGSQVGAVASGTRAKASSKGAQEMNTVLAPESAKEVATALAELLILLRALEVPKSMKPKLDDTVGTVQEAKDVATSSAPDKDKLSTAWSKVKGWVTSALDLGLFVEGAAEKVKDLVEKVGGLLG